MKISEDVCQARLKWELGARALPIQKAAKHARRVGGSDQRRPLARIEETSRGFSGEGGTVVQGGIMYSLAIFPLVTSNFISRVRDRPDRQERMGPGCEMRSEAMPQSDHVLPACRREDWDSFERTKACRKHTRSSRSRSIQSNSCFCPGFTRLSPAFTGCDVGVLNRAPRLSARVPSGDRPCRAANAAAVIPIGLKNMLPDTRPIAIKAVSLKLTHLLLASALPGSRRPTSCGDLRTRLTAPGGSAGPRAHGS